MQYSSPLENYTKIKDAFSVPTSYHSTAFRPPTYIYSIKCLKIIKVNEKPAAKIKQFRRIKGKLNFKINVSTKLY